MKHEMKREGLEGVTEPPPTNLARGTAKDPIGTSDKETREGHAHDVHHLSLTQGMVVSGEW